MEPSTPATAAPSASPALRELLASLLGSYERLELALVLRDCPDGLSLADVARKLQFPPDVMSGVSEELAQRGFAELLPGGIIRLTPSEAQAQLLAEAAALNAQDRTYLVRVQTSLAIERIRSHAARTFAEAFRIRAPHGRDEPVNTREGSPSSLVKLVVKREPR